VTRGRPRARQALGKAGPGGPELRQEPTGLPLATLQWVGRSMSNVPDGFALHADIQRLLAARRRAPATAGPAAEAGAAVAEAGVVAGSYPKPNI
jgi:2-oxoglutarate dehydrogenase complex dehydrogenase (E1) component-like enzyme